MKTFIAQIITKIAQNNRYAFAYFSIINLPFLILTWDTKNWSDDFQLTNLYAIKAKFSPLLPLLFEKSGAHFSPVYNILNYLFTFVTVQPNFFHFIIIVCYILTAFFVFLIVKKYYQKESLALLAGTLFALNYYVGFKALAWNCFHSHVTNTLTGIISVYYLLCYLSDDRKSGLIYSAFFFLLSILNFESGFVFYPVLIVLAIFLRIKNKIKTQKLLKVIAVYSAVMLAYPAGSYFSAGEAFPLAYRFQLNDTRWTRNVQNYAFNANDLLIKSSGLSLLYNKAIFDPLRSNSTLKEALSSLIKRNNLAALKTIPPIFFIIFGILALLTIFFAIFIAIMIWTRIQPETRLFVYLYGGLFFIYIFIFYRVDIANAIGIFSSIIIADFILSLLVDKKQTYKRLGWGIVAFYVAVTAGTLFNRFEDCYEKAFFFFTRKTLHGPQRVYDAMNKKLGHLADRGLLLFTHDYSSYRRENGERRIGDMVWLGDFACYNATVFYKDLLKTDIIAVYKNRPFSDFVEKLKDHPNNQRIYVESQNDALRYLKEHQIDLNKTDALYMSWDYQIENLKDAL